MKTEKICQTCGRVIEWRKRWATCWDEIRYCSKRCRNSKPDAVDGRLEKAILKLLDRRT